MINQRSFPVDTAYRILNERRSQTRPLHEAPKPAETALERPKQLGQGRAQQMSLPELKIDSASIAIVGTFKPQALTPAALAASGLLGKDEALSALSPVLVPNLSLFDASWLHAEITANRALISTSDPAESVRLCDVATGILAMAPVPAVSAVGLNRDVHFQIESAEEWHTIGDRLIPKTNWDDVLKLPGTRGLVVQGNRSDNYVGYVQVTVEPSFRMPPGTVGMLVGHNDHYMLKKATAQPLSREEFLDPAMQEPNYVEPSTDRVPMAKDIINSKWAQSMKHAEQVIERVWNLRTGG